MSAEDRIEIALTINDRAVTVRPRLRDRLLDVLREDLGLTGTKEGCGEGECGACTVYLDDLPVNSCLIPAYQARGHRVTTVESLTEAAVANLHSTGATQCGACTPGVAMTARFVARRDDLLDRFTVRQLMAGNLCRCTGYDGIVEGVEADLAADAATEDVGDGSARSRPS